MTSAGTFIIHHYWRSVLRATISGSIAELDDAVWFLAASLPVEAERLDALNRAVEKARVALREGRRVEAARAFIDAKADILPPEDGR